MKHSFTTSRILSALLIFFTGCDTEELHDLNIPLNAVNMDVNYFFTAAELGTASNGSSESSMYADLRTNIILCGHCIQQLATLNTESPGTGDKYLNYIEPSIAPFELYFTDVGNRTREILRKTGPGGESEGRKINTRHAARILRVLNFHRLTDWYGNIPYTEANRIFDGFLNPAYDKQKDIYADMLRELDEACTGLSSDNMDEGFAAADIIFRGDISKWKKWGYSLMLRLAMRVSNADQKMAADYVTKASQGGVMNSNTDNVWVPMSLTPLKTVNQNGISRAFQPGDGGQNSFLSKTLIDWLMGPDKNDTKDDDPRLMVLSGGIAQWTTSGWTTFQDGTDPLKQAGMPNGLDQPMLDAIYGKPVLDYKLFSRVNPKLLQSDEPYQLMNAAESKFLLAEALERGIGTGITGTAEQYYNEGVRLAMQMYTKYDISLAVTDEAVNQYLATFPYGVAKPALEMTGEQMWVSKFMNWWEAWSDWRRTGYPNLLPVTYSSNITGGTIPTKLRLLPNEASVNPNYATGATMPDELTTKVWWDGGPE